MPRFAQEKTCVNIIEQRSWKYVVLEDRDSKTTAKCH